MRSMAGMFKLLVELFFSLMKLILWLTIILPFQFIGAVWLDSWDGGKTGSVSLPRRKRSDRRKTYNDAYDDGFWDGFAWFD